MPEITARLSTALADRYKIERHLGEGGMATVYLAHDLKHDRKVAVKVLRPELAAVLGAERFIQEIKTTANLQHPHILPLFDSGEADGFLYYVMPFIDGETLRDKLNRETQLGIDEAVKITTEVADALDYAHRNNVIHRDIKPENILLHDGRPMVADFGIALALSAAAGGRMTETGMSLGTPHYMSPEQATAEKDLTNRSDVYSLGAVLYEMLTGEPPHMGNSAQQIIMKIVADDVRPVTELRKSVPPHVAGATAKALEKLAADRFPSAAEFAAALADTAFTWSDATAPQAAGTAGVGAGRVTTKHLVAAGGLVALGVALGLLASGDSPAPEVVRFTLGTPSSHSLELTRVQDVPFAISPNGDRIVYVARDSVDTRTTRLYTRMLDQIDGVPLTGTDDAVSPFFSPDGLWVGFHTSGDGSLKKVPLAGGPPITLAENVATYFFSSASWGDDGYIVYGLRGRRRLARVSGAGGPVEVILSRDEYGKIMLWPQVLPGGRAVLFQSCATPTSCESGDLVVLDTETKTVTTVVEGAARGWFANTGHLVYSTQDGAIYAAPFDPKRLELTGAPVAMLDGVRVGILGGARLAISPSGTMIYLPGAAATAVRILAVDRTGRPRTIAERLGRFAHPRLSPDGRRIALTSFEGSDQIVIYDITSETFSQLTFEGENERPSWSPDGTRLAFNSDRSGNWDIHWKAADGSRPAERVADGPDHSNTGATFWTRDGAWIVFDGVPEMASQQTHDDVLAVSTGDERTVRPVVATPAHEEAATVSPDGRWIAYASNESGERQVYVRPFLEPGGRFAISAAGGMTPVWVTDRELVYVDEISQTLVSAVLNFDNGVRVAERTSLFDVSSYGLTNNAPGFDVSRDGQEFLMLDPQGGDTADPIVVLNWFEEIERRVAEQGGN